VIEMDTNDNNDRMSPQVLSLLRQQYHADLKSCDGLVRGPPDYMGSFEAYVRHELPNYEMQRKER